MTDLIHSFIRDAAQRDGTRAALGAGPQSLSYEQLDASVERVARGLCALGIARGDRVAIWLDKRIETVVSIFGASRAGAVFVPVNPVLKEAQVLHILQDSGSTVLVTNRDRLGRLSNLSSQAHSVRYVVLIDARDEGTTAQGLPVMQWNELLDGAQGAPHRHIDFDLAAILYTSGSTGRPKGVTLSHRNMVAGAHSVSSYLENTDDDRILALLPLSFDAGLSQLTTAFHRGAFVHLFNYLLPRDVPRAVERMRITGLGAVPPVWIPLSRLDWPAAAVQNLRYITNTGGAMPLSTLTALRQRLPQSKVYLMYGLTEAFRSTFLAPEELDRRPDSIGKAIPNAEILVVRPNGDLCEPNEPGELVHRGALVAQGYWKDAAKTAERFRPAPGQPDGLVNPELAVWSGDTVRRDEEGFLYFVGRRDDMIKTSGYRVSPTEVEEALYESGLVAEAVAFGRLDADLGQSVFAVVLPSDSQTFTVEKLFEHCRKSMPSYMVPQEIVVHHESLPRNPNGKIDRPALKTQLLGD